MLKSDVHLIDCVEFMRGLPDNYFSLSICDPPYNVGADKPSIKPESVKQKNGTYLQVKSNKHKHKDWDSELPTDEYFNQLFRVSKNQIIFGGNYFSQCSGGAIVWDKLNGESDQYDCEIAYQSFNKRTDKVYFMWSGMFQGVYCGRDIYKALKQQGNKKLNEERIHPCHKPTILYRWLLRSYAKSGDTIFDSHMGSQSSRIACHMEGFDFTGCELDPEYFEKGNVRYDTFLKTYGTPDPTKAIQGQQINLF